MNKLDLVKATAQTQWCGGRDLNPRTTKDWDLNPAQLAWLCDPRYNFSDERGVLEGYCFTFIRTNTEPYGITIKNLQIRADLINIDRIVSYDRRNKKKH